MLGIMLLVKSITWLSPERLLAIASKRTRPEVQIALKTKGLSPFGICFQ